MASNPTSSPAPQLEAATRKYQDLQEELSKAVSSREKLGAQQVETESVKKVMQCLN
jgi:chaperonin cofactor prefoldin